MISNAPKTSLFRASSQCITDPTQFLFSHSPNPQPLPKIYSPHPGNGHTHTFKGKVKASVLRQIPDLHLVAVPSWGSQSAFWKSWAPVRKWKTRFVKGHYLVPGSVKVSRILKLNFRQLPTLCLLKPDPSRVSDIHRLSPCRDQGIEGGDENQQVESTQVAPFAVSLLLLLASFQDGWAKDW